MSAKTEKDKQRIIETIKKNKYDLRDIVDLLPCKDCEWRWSMHCPKCNWNKNGKYQTY